MTEEHVPGDLLIRAVAEHWAEIIRLADGDQRERLRGLVAGTEEPSPAEALAALADELLELLPPDHTVIRVMGTRVMRVGQETSQEDETLAAALRWLRGRVLADGAEPVGAGDDPPPAESPGEEPAPDGPGPSDAASDASGAGEGAGGDEDAIDETGARGSRDARGSQDDFDRQVEDRLLRLPSLSADDVRRNQIDPDSEGLVRLPRPDRAVQYPAFQFTPAGTPWMVVQELNKVLNAASDPWGVTCWWADPHERLGASPADLLGQGRDDLLRQAVSTVGEDY